MAGKKLSKRVNGGRAPERSTSAVSNRRIPYRLTRPGIVAVRSSIATGHVFDDELTADGAIVPDAERDVPKEWRVA